MFFGFSELLVVLLMGTSGGSIGLPLGVPPAPEDPRMAQVAPQECIIYCTWSALTTPEAANNPTERWLAQPELQKSIIGLRDLVRQQMIDSARNNVGDAEAQVAEVWFDVAQATFTGATAVFVTQLEMIGDEWRVDGGLVTNLGDQASSIREKLESLPQLFEEPFPVSTVHIDGVDYWHWQFDEDVSLIWTVDGDYLIAGLSEQTIRQIRASWDAAPPQWLAGVRERLAVERISSVSVVNTAPLLRLVEGIDQPELPALIDTLGLRHLRSAAWVTGLDANGFVSKAEFEVDRSATGIWKVIGSDPIRPDQLLRVPNDASLVIIQQLNWTALYDLVEEVTAAEDWRAEGFRSMVEEFQNTTGIQLREQLLTELAPTVTLYGSPTITNPTRGWVLATDVTSELAFSAIHQEMMENLRAAFEERDETESLVEKTVNGLTIFALANDAQQVLPPMFQVDPCWSVANGQWAGSLNQAALRRHLRADLALADSMADRSELQFLWPAGPAAKSGPIGISILDPKPFVENLLGMIEPLQAMDPGAETDAVFKLIPPMDVLTRDLGLNVSGIYQTERGFEIVQRQTLPGGSPVVTMAALGGGFFTTASQTRAAAGQFESANNLRQLMLACLSFEAVHKAFPAAYSTDDNGKPLLSWRVHILPYLDEDDLYRQFHLDEPWDSPHNKELIALMPDVFAHPKLELEPGMTAYLAVVGKSAVFSPPQGDDKATQPLGLKMAKIVDGMSSTAAIVELDADQSVIWTKPDDFDITDIESVDERLAGPWAKGMWWAAFCDGSVQPIPGEMPEETVQRLLQFDDGQPVDLPWRDDVIITRPEGAKLQRPDEIK